MLDGLGFVIKDPLKSASITTHNCVAKLGLGVPIGSAKPQLGELICGGIVRVFGGFIIGNHLKNLPNQVRL